MNFEIHPIPALEDNYVYALLDPKQRTLLIDPAEATPVLSFLDLHHASLEYILNTHHHWDHTGGNEMLKKHSRCEILGPKTEAGKIPAIDRSLQGGEDLELLGLSIKTLDSSGHTLGHLSYWFPTLNALFVGDALFSLGCGRIFEGTAEQMWSSLQRLRTLPPTTQIYFGHEYTLKNAKFALTIDPQNKRLQNYAEEVERLRLRKLPTVPTTLEREFTTNPFLRADDPKIRQHLGMERAENWQVFAEIRRRKDNF